MHVVLFSSAFVAFVGTIIEFDYVLGVVFLFLTSYVSVLLFLLDSYWLRMFGIQTAFV